MSALSRREFEEWLNERRNLDVAFVFHDIVERYAAANAPELRVSACYFPGTGDAELSWERDGKSFAMTVKVTPEQGNALANVVWPCIYWPAQAVADAKRHPLAAYVDSYRCMAKMGDGNVHASTVAMDIERNMIPVTVAKVAR